MWEQKQFGNNWEVEKRNLSVEQVESDPFLEKVDQKTVASAKTFRQYKMSVNQSNFRYGAFKNSVLETQEHKKYSPVLLWMEAVLSFHWRHKNTRSIPQCCSGWKQC